MKRLLIIVIAVLLTASTGFAEIKMLQNVMQINNVYPSGNITVSRPYVPSFNLPLITSLVPTYSAGSGTPTFVRATEARDFFTNNDGNLQMQTVPSGAARFSGARYVRNLLSVTSTPSNDFSEVKWTKTGTASVTGTNTLNLPAVLDTIYHIDFTSYANKYIQCSVTLSGNGTSQMLLSNNVDQTVAVVNLTLSQNSVRYSISGTFNGTNGDLLFSVRRATGQTATTITVNDAQCEDLTSMTNTAPNDYVSVGVLSAPFHGAGVDGVKFFDTQNSCVVNSNVVTGCGAGAAIASATLKGYLPEGARTNPLFQSRNFGTTWVDANCAGAAGSCEAQNVVGIDGVSNSAWTLTDDNAAGVTYWVSNAITIANDNAVHVCSVYIKKDTDTARFPYMNCSLTVGVTQTQQCHLNTQTGAVVEEADTGSNDTCTATLTPNGLWWLFQTTATNNTSGNTTLTMYISPARGTVIGSSNVAATGSAIFDQAQVELNSTFASSPIVTTTAAVTRNADSLSYPAVNYDVTKGTALARVSSMWGTSGGGIATVLGNSVNGRMIGRAASSASTALHVFDGTNLLNSTTSISYQNNPLRICTSWGSVGQSAAYNNTTVTTGSFDGAMGTGALYVGSYGVAGSEWFGNVSGVKIWKYKTPDSYCQRIGQ